MNKRNLQHGHRPANGYSPTYKTWASMKNRCKYPYDVNYANYGGRGILVCERWQKFVNFLADMGERPPGKTLDRINNDGNYEPGNCRWVSPEDQMLNQRPRKRLDEWTGVELQEECGRRDIGVVLEVC